MKRFFGVSFISGVSAMSGMAIWNRPIFDDQDDNNGPDRADKAFLSKSSPFDQAGQEPYLMKMARVFASVPTMIVFRTIMQVCGDFKIKKNQEYLNFVDKVVDRGSAALITVSNHRSLVDDPGVVPNLLPMSIAAQPRHMRWGLCAQEYCYNPKLPILMHAYFGAGKALPMKRGSGINQKLLLDFARQGAAGAWLHIFPEAGVWQNDDLGGRSDEKMKTLGKLKWGVGKLIAHAPEPPVVIPFFFTGTEHITPQNPISRNIETFVPFGHKVTVRFGKELCFDDLIEEHENKFGPLRKYAASAGKDEQRGDFHKYWDSLPHEYALYHKIALRIEDALQQLNAESKEDLKHIEKYGRFPDV